MATTGTVATLVHPTGIRTARDLTLLLGRVGLAVLMIAHAKLEYDYGGGSIAGVGRLFEQAGVPLAVVTGPANLLFEAIGGVALILGLGVPVVGVLMALNMLGAWVLVHPTALYAADHTGPETVIADWTAQPGARRHRLRTLPARPPDRPPRGPPDASSSRGFDSLNRAAASEGNMGGGTLR